MGSACMPPLESADTQSLIALCKFGFGVEVATCLQAPDCNWRPSIVLLAAPVRKISRV